MGGMSPEGCMLVVTLREGWFMGRVIVTEDEFAPSILVHPGNGKRT